MAREPLDRHRHRQHQPVLVVHPLGRGGDAGQGAAHFAVDPPVIAAFRIGLQPREGAHAHDAVIEALDTRPSTWLAGVQRRQFAGLHHIALQQIAGVDRQIAAGQIKPRRAAASARSAGAAEVRHRRPSGSGFRHRWHIPPGCRPRWWPAPARRSAVLPPGRGPTGLHQDHAAVSTSSASALKARMRQVRAEKCGTIRGSDSRRHRASRWRRNHRPPP